MADCSSFSLEDTANILEKGYYTIRVGNSSVNTTPVCMVKIAEDLVVAKLKNVVDNPCFSDLLIKREGKNEICGQIITLTANDFSTYIPDYVIDKSVHPDVKGFSDQAVMNMCLGAYVTETNGVAIGNSGLHVVGAAGESNNHILKETKGKYVVYADGPAGVRLPEKLICLETGLVPSFDLSDMIINALPKEFQMVVRQVNEMAPRR